jgi:ubiquinone/menaquinone biosynthesis C-methylase UbiE
MATDPGKNTYIIDTESGAEMARLLHQDRLLTRGMGGLLAEKSNDFSGFHHVLDVACGPGGWAQEVARAYPNIEVVGIDISVTMINYANAQVQAQDLGNARFLVMDALKPLDFPDAFFDLVNLRFISGFAPTRSWSAFIQELLRICKVGGTIRITDTELGDSNSSALEKMVALLIKAVHKGGQCFSPDERRLGNTAMLARYLRQKGCQNVGLMTHLMEYSAGTEYHSGFYQDWKVAFKLVQPLFISLDITTQEEVDEVYNQMLVDMVSEDFCAVYDLVTAWGEKA